MIQHDGDISAPCDVQSNADMIGGTYSGGLRFRVTSTTSAVIVLTGNFVVGSLELETLNTGDLSLDCMNVTSMSILGDLTLDMDDADAGDGDIYVECTSSTAVWEIRGDIINQLAGDTFTWTVGDTTMLLSGTGNQDIDFDGKTMPNTVINKPTSGNVTLNNCVVQLNAIDMAGGLEINTSTITSSANAKNITGDVDWSDAGNNISCGTGTVWTLDGDFDYSLIGTLTQQTATFALAGISKTVAGAGIVNRPYNLTFDTDSSYQITAATGIDNGLLLVKSGATVDIADGQYIITSTSGDMQVQSGAVVSGAGTGYVNMWGSLTQQDGEISAECRVRANGSLVGGNYSGLVRFQETGAVNRAQTMAGTFVMGSLEFETTSTGTLSIDATGLTGMTVLGDTTFDMDDADAGDGDITIDCTGSSIAWEFQGDVIDELAGDTFTWTVGSTTIRLGGTSNQTIDLRSIASSPPLSFDKTAGNVILETANLVLLDSQQLGGNLTVNSGDVDTTTGATLNFDGDVTLANNQFDMGDGTTWNICGNFDHSAVTTYIPGTAIISALCRASLNSFATLFINAITADTDVISLYVYGGYGLTITTGRTLEIHGHQALNSFESLQITGMVVEDEERDLFIRGVGVTNAVGFLYMLGSKNLVNSYATLMVAVDNSAYNDNATLYVENDQTELVLSGSGTLFINSVNLTSESNAPLFIMNEGSSVVRTLFIKAPSGLTNALPYSNTATLFINRPNEAVAMSLFLKAFDTGANTFAPLYIVSRGTISTPSGRTLVIPNVVVGGTNTFNTLYTRGVLGFPFELRDLVIPNVFDTDIASLPLYVFGWG